MSATVRRQSAAIVAILAVAAVVVVSSGTDPQSGQPAPTTAAPVATAAATTLPATTVPATTAAPDDLPADTDLRGCPDAARAAVADKAAQRFWLCADGHSITEALPMTTASAAYGLPRVGTYKVFSRQALAYGIGGERLNRFVAFDTTSRGNRIAFHEYVDQDPDTLGDLDQRGKSSGCFRVTTEASQLVWDYLEIGDPVVILTN